MPISSFDRKSVAGRFSAAANTYSRHAGVQMKAAAGLINLVDRTPAIKSILEIGCGTGILTAKLAKKFPTAKIHAVDISAAMICESKERLGLHGNIKWLAGDFLELAEAGKFDLIISSSSLHWITPLRKTFKMAGTLLKNNGTFIFSIMLKGTLGELHAARSRIAPAKKVPRQLPTRNEVLAALKSCGFKTAHRHIELSRSLFPSASELLKSLHKQGVTSGQFASGKTPLNRGELQRLISWYNMHYKSCGGVFATYKVLYIVANKQKELFSPALPR